MKKILTVMVLVSLSFMSCGKKTRYVTGPVGPSGAAGSAGLDGNDGQDAEPCTVASVQTSSLYPNGGAVISCGSSTVVVQNGSPGNDGATGLPGANAVLEIIDPCGNNPSVNHDEVLLRLANGQVLASFSDNASGQNTRFSLIGPGTYSTTDGSVCQFTINSDLTVTW